MSRLLLIAVLFVAPHISAQTAQPAGDRPSSGVLAPKPLYTPEPEYTPEARKAKLEGIVKVRFVVEANGKVFDVTVVQSLGMGLDESTVATIKKWRFSPATRDKKPVRALCATDVPFHLYPAIP